DARPREERHFDAFYYFYDFDLARRFWKLGGHVDDHRGVSFDHGRTRGFLELALGRADTENDCSRPVTADVWILARLIEECCAFLPVAPHSLHVSLQADNTRPFSRLHNPAHLRCLLLLGGDLSVDRNGVLREKRIYQKEAATPYTGIQFSRLNAHASDPGGEAATPVVEFTFLRLEGGRDYVPLLLALKGFQWATNPMPLTLASDSPNLQYHRQIERDLIRWARRPEPLGDSDVAAFVADVECGLERERVAGGRYPPEYLGTALARIETLLRQRNRMLREFARRDRQFSGYPEKKG
ncbi:MAG: hypothetical protein QHJ73_03435, partial [Armatimonadota bacterium]|nr:hypothetical protein [Armatimonadota bacterium]